MNLKSLLTRVLLLPVLSLLLTGCPPKNKSAVEVLPPAGPGAEGSAGAGDTPVSDLSGALSIGTDWTSVPALSPVYFEKNQSDLSQEARDLLKKNGEILKVVLASASGVQVRMEGHCDERGTVEYNLALGQRRANAVKNYYQSLNLKNLSTVSYGEEKPSCMESNEECWAKNRRGETTLKASSPVNIPADKLPQ